jgi:hypothetical protein
MAPNSELVAPVHDRMPVILQRQLERPWLDPDVEAQEALLLPAALPGPNEGAPGLAAIEQRPQRLPRPPQGEAAA